MFSWMKSKRTWTILLTAASVILVWGAEARAQGKKYCAMFSGDIGGTVPGLNYVRRVQSDGAVEALQGPAMLTFKGDVATQILGVFQLTGSEITLTGSVIIRVFTSKVGTQSADMGFDWKVGKLTYHLTLQPQSGIVLGSLATSATLTFVNDPFRLTVSDAPNLIIPLPYSNAHVANVGIFTKPQ